MPLLTVRNRVSGKSSLSQQSRHGVTLLEVLLVFSVILLNVAIFLPFVRRTQDAARANQCKQNMKQLGLAISNYQEAYNSYPSGFDIPRDGSYPGWGWNFKLLPYMNAADVYQTFEPHLTDGISKLSHVSHQHRRLPELLCPSNTALEMFPHALSVNAQVVDGVVSAGTEEWQYRHSQSSYFGNVGYLQENVGGIKYNASGVATIVVPLTNKGSLGHAGTLRSQDHRYCDSKNFGGYFGQNSRVTLRHVVDGTSNTFMIGERYSPADSSSKAVGYGSWIGVPDCTSDQGLAMALGDASVRMNVGMPLREQTTGFGSMHEAGAFFTLGDGSTRFISQDIDLILYRNLSVIDDGSR